MLIPDCNRCPAKADGARFIKYVDGGGMGRQAWVAEFLCRACNGNEFFAINVANLAQWRLAVKTDRGVYGVRKLDEDQQNERAIKLREQRS